MFSGWSCLKINQFIDLANKAVTFSSNNLFYLINAMPENPIPFVMI